MFKYSKHDRQTGKAEITKQLETDKQLEILWLDKTKREADQVEIEYWDNYYAERFEYLANPKMQENSTNQLNQRINHEFN